MSFILRTRTPSGAFRNLFWTNCKTVSPLVCDFLDLGRYVCWARPLLHLNIPGFVHVAASLHESVSASLNRSLIVISTSLKTSCIFSRFSSPIVVVVRILLFAVGVEHDHHMSTMSSSSSSSIITIAIGSWMLKYWNIKLGIILLNVSIPCWNQMVRALPNPVSQTRWIRSEKCNSFINFAIEVAPRIQFGGSKRHKGLTVREFWTNGGDVGCVML